MEDIVITGDRSERTNDGRLSALTDEIDLRVRRERHRRWRPDEKLRIVQETLHPGAVIAAVARRHGVGTSLLYTWRKDMLSTAMSGFVPVEVKPDCRFQQNRRPRSGGLRLSSQAAFVCGLKGRPTRQFCGASYQH